MPCRFEEEVEGAPVGRVRVPCVHCAVLPSGLAEAEERMDCIDRVERAERSERESSTEGAREELL